MKTVNSTSKKFPGHVLLPEFLNIAQVRAFEDSLGDPGTKTPDPDRKVWLSVSDAKRIPVILQCVAEWHIEGIPEKPSVETLPMTPVRAAHDLYATIYAAIREMWIGEIEIPNG